MPDDNFPERTLVVLQYIIVALQEGFIYGILALGIFISLRILNIPDLTAEGSFGVGAATAAVLAANGFTFLSLFAGLLAGTAAGFITGLLQTRLRVHPVLAGIITMSGAYSVKLIIMRNTTNVPCGNYSVFTLLKQRAEAMGLDGTAEKLLACALCLVIAAVLILILVWFFHTHTGLCIRATGDNPDMVRASSINVNLEKMVGLCVSNALIGLSGALIAHYNSASDVSTSNGTLVYGLAAVIIGEAIFGRRSITVGLISAVAGSLIYKLIYAFVIKSNLFGSYSANLMKLLCALIVAVTLAIPAGQEYLRQMKLRWEAGKHA